MSMSQAEKAMLIAQILTGLRIQENTQMEQFLCESNNETSFDDWLIGKATEIAKKIAKQTSNKSDK